MPHSRFRAALLTMGVLLAGASLAAAQTPSADDIIKSLKPGAGFGTSTRGIKPAKPATVAQPIEPAAASAPVAHAAMAAPKVAPPEAEATAPSVNLTVQFATGSAQLTPSAMHTLDELGRALSSQTLASYKFRIEGHTDTVGRAELNLSLSQARAAAVVSYLSGKFSVTPDRLEAVGRGSQALLVPTPDQTPEPRNRRVQVINLGA